MEPFLFIRADDSNHYQDVLDGKLYFTDPIGNTKVSNQKGKQDFFENKSLYPSDKDGVFNIFCPKSNKFRTFSLIAINCKYIENMNKFKRDIRESGIAKGRKLTAIGSNDLKLIIQSLNDEYRSKPRSEKDKAYFEVKPVKYSDDELYYGNNGKYPSGESTEEVKDKLVKTNTDDIFDNLMVKPERFKKQHEARIIMSGTEVDKFSQPVDYSQLTKIRFQKIPDDFFDN